MSSIVIESRKSRRKSRSILILLIIIISAVSAYYLFFKDKVKTDTEDTTVELVKEAFQVYKDDLKISINSTGKIVNEDSVNLSFSDVGMKITDVYVKEGDIVKKGDKLAQVDNSAYISELKSAEASKDVAIKNLETAQKGGSDIDLELAKKELNSAEMEYKQVKEQNELSLKSSKTNLANAKRNLETIKDEVLNAEKNEDLSIEDVNLSLSQSIEDGVIKLNSVLKDINDSLDEVDKILDDDDTLEVLGNLKNRSLDDANDSYDDADRMEREYYLNFPRLPETNQENFLINAFTQVYVVLESVEIMHEDMLELFDNTEPNTSFTSSDLSRLENSIDSLLNDIKSDKDSVIGSKQSIESNVQNRDSKIESSDISIENDQNSILDAEEKVFDAELEYEKTLKNIEMDEKSASLKLEIANTQYKQKTDGVTGADLASLLAQIDKAQVQVDQAIYNLGLTTLLSPIDGEVTEFNGTIGDIVADINNEPFAIIINRNSFFVDAEIEEIDISKLEIGQKIYATIEALDDIELPGTISHIAVTGEIDNNGVVSYAVTSLLDDSILKDNSSSDKFLNPLRSGMTADIDFIIKETKNVLIIPVSAVKRVDNEPKVELENGEFVPVKTGFTDGKMVEIISGLNEGDKVMYIK